MTHSLCYLNTSNIEITETPEIHPYEEKLAAIALTIPKMSHADLDELGSDLRNFLKHTGRRTLLVNRRNSAAVTIKRKIETIRKVQITTAKRAAFIGPLNIQMQNGHPF
jgi:IS1 family transposase